MNDNKYLDLAKEQKKRNLKVIGIPIVVGVLEVVPKDLDKRLEKLEIKGRIEISVRTDMNIQKNP